MFQNSKLLFWTKFGIIYAYYCIHLLLGCILFLCPSVTKFFWIDRTNIYISQNLCQIYPKKSFFLKIRVSNIRISSRFNNFFDFCFSALLLRYFVIASNTKQLIKSTHCKKPFYILYIPTPSRKPRDQDFNQYKVKLESQRRSDISLQKLCMRPVFMTLYIIFLFCHKRI